MSSEKAHIEGLPSETPSSNEKEHENDASSGSEDSEDVNSTQPSQAGPSEAGASAPNASAGASSRKKKKKKSKVTKLLSALRPNDTLHEAIVDHVMSKASEQQEATAPGTASDGAKMDREAIRKALEQLQLGDVLKGKAGIGGKNRKEMGEHKVS